MEMEKINLKRRRRISNMVCCDKKKRKKMMNRRSSSNCHELIGGILLLPEDLIIEVLFRLPVRDVRRAKCVCKQWQSVISSPKFVEAYGRRPKHEHCSYGIFVATADNEAREFLFYYSSLLEEDKQQGKRKMTSPPFSRSFVPRFRVSYTDYQWITQVVNGLVCVYSTNRLTLVNLCTGEMVDLPLPPLPPADAFCRTVIDFYCQSTHEVHKLEFSPRMPAAAKAINRTTIVYYFGFDTLHNVYKVLSLSYMCRAKCRGPGNVCRCPAFIMPQVLTLCGPVSSYNWKEVPYPGVSNKKEVRTFCFDGTLYWVKETKKIPRSKRIPSIIASSFNLKHHFFWAVLAHELLPQSYEFFSRFKLSHFGGCLTLLDCYASRKRLHVYSYLSDIRKWGKLKLCLPRELRGGNSNIHDVTPVGCLPNGDILLANDKVDEFYTPVYTYDCESDSFKRFVVGKFPPAAASMSRTDTAICITCAEENLASLRLLINWS